MSGRPRPAERLVFFSDAVVAIAMTLLVLPLVDSVPGLLDDGRPAAAAISENGWEITSFLLTFVVIARQWLSHHHLFEQIRYVDVVLMWLNIAWLLTVAVLPFPTELTGAYGADRFAVLFYIGTVLANTLCLTAMTLYVRRTRGLAHDASVIDGRWVFGSVGASVALVLAFALSALVPAAGYYSLLLLFVPPQLARFRYR
ncbi:MULTISPECIES: TMEM175 family protein [Amycolatopsis]|uniref:Putative membrane protein n=1 Tax=Amycolatopsis thermoflava TaxID=84480 RepID=A0A3N2G6E9_9PSEU|nr:TMEM175 family protein [Amycolatopsis thermoflava]ROS32212.1 putative membrane protein [Amycolatopsis thermoflava]